MLKVLLVDEAPGADAALREALSEAQGLRVVGVVASMPELAARIAETRPDLVVFGAGSALDRCEVERGLREDLEEARARLAERKLVERAKGILMKQRGCSEEQAFAALRTLAMQRGARLGEVARQVIDVASLLG